MSDVDVCVRHSLGADEAKSRLLSFEKRIAGYGAKLHWEGNLGTVSGPGFSGHVDVQDDLVRIDLKLSMIVRMAGAKPESIRRSIERSLESSLS